jgi:hypothetical protein
MVGKRLTSFVIDQEVFLHHLLLDAKEIQSLPQDLVTNSMIPWSLMLRKNGTACLSLVINFSRV